MTSAARFARRSQAHATKKTTRTTRKTKPKARRRGAVPANPLGDRLPLFPPRNAFFHWLYSRSMYLLNLLFRSGYGSIVPRGRQRPQNRRLKHSLKRIMSRVRNFPCSVLLLYMRHFVRLQRNDFGFVPLTSAVLLFMVPTFTVLCTSACCPKKANTNSEVLKWKCSKRINICK